MDGDKTVNKKYIKSVCPIVMPISNETIGFFIEDKMISII